MLLCQVRAHKPGSGGFCRDRNGSRHGRGCEAHFDLGCSAAQKIPEGLSGPTGQTSFQSQFGLRVIFVPDVFKQQVCWEKREAEEEEEEEGGEEAEAEVLEMKTKQKEVEEVEEEEAEEESERDRQIQLLLCMVGA